MSKPGAQADEVGGGISVERTFGWGPEIIALAIAWGGLLGVVAPGPDENPMVAAGLMGVALVFLAWRLAKRRHRVRVAAFPERNEAEIFFNGTSRKRVPFTSLSILIQNGSYTFGPAVGFAGLFFVFAMLALPGGAPTGLLRIFSAGAALLAAALLATHLRTRLLHRELYFPKGRILVPVAEGQQIALELGLYMLRPAAAENPKLWQRSLSLSLVKIGDQRRERGNVAGALAAYEESVSIDRAASAADPANADLQDAIRKTLDKIGDLARK